MNSMPILLVCMYVYMSSTDRSVRMCPNVARLASSTRYACPQMLCILQYSVCTWKAFVCDQVVTPVPSYSIVGGPINHNIQTSGALCTGG